MKQLLATLLALLGWSQMGLAQSRCWGSPEPFRMVYDGAEVFDYSDEAWIQVAIEQFNHAFDVTLLEALQSELPRASQE